LCYIKVTNYFNDQYILGASLIKQHWRRVWISTFYYCNQFNGNSSSSS